MSIAFLDLGNLKGDLRAGATTKYKVSQNQAEIGFS